MRDETHVSTTTYSVPSSVESRNGGKYSGLIKQSFLRVLRDDLIRFFSYIHSITTEASSIPLYITILRLLQFFGPSLCLQDVKIWEPNGQDKSTITFLSFLIHLIPTRYRRSIFDEFAIIYDILMISILGSVMFFSYKYKETSSVPLFFAKSLNMVFLTIGEIIPAVAFQMSFEALSYEIFQAKSTVMSSYYLIISVIALNTVFLVIIFRITTDDLVFRPMSLMTLTVKPQNVIRIVTYSLTIIYAFSTYASQTLKLAICIVSIVLYLYSYRIHHINGGFIFLNDSVFFMATYITAIISSIGSLTFSLLGIKGRLIHLVALAILFIILLFISNALIRKAESKNLAILDIVDENQCCLDIETVDDVLGIALSGFRIAHPTCLDWKVFRHGLERWENDVNLWYSFAKFVMIYPEESQTLGWIYSSVFSLHLKGSVSRTMKMGLKMITREREFNMCPLLKSKLNVIMKQVQNTKHKLRRVWDVAIQGNLGEIEPTSKRAAASIEKNDSDFKELIFEFPNNRFVTRAYARFLFEIVGNNQKGFEMNDNTKKLARGLLVSQDKAHDLGLKAFPLLPIRLNESNVIDITNKVYANESYPTGPNDLDLDMIHDSDKNEISVIQDRINALSFPAIRNTTIMRVLIFFVFFVCLFISLMILIYQLYDQQVAPLQHIYHLAQIGQYVSMATAFSERYLLQSLGLIQSSIPLTSKLPSNLGNTWNIQKQIVFFLRKVSTVAQELESLRKYEDGVSAVIKAKEIIFGNSINYSTFSSPTDISYFMISIQNIFGDYIIQLEKISQKNVSDFNYSDLNSTMLLNPVKNLDQINSGLETTLDLFRKYIISRNQDYTVLFQKILIIIVVLVIISLMGFLFISLRGIHSNKLEVYRCLTSLPKNTVSNIAENLRVIKKEADGSSTSKDSELSKQEENILKVFNSAASGENSSSESIIIIIGTIMLVLFNILSLFFVYNLALYEIQRIDDNVPHIQYLHNSFTSMFSAVSMINHLASFFTPYHITIYTIEQMKTIINNRMAQGIKNLHLSWFGGRGEGPLPFLQFDNLLAQGNKASLCRGRSASTGIYLEELICRPIDTVFNLAQPYLQRHINMHTHLGLPIDYSDNYTRIFWDTSLYPVYDRFFAEMSKQIVPSILAELVQEQENVFPIVLLLLVVSTVIEIVILYQIQSIDKHLRFVLGLLQHCPTSIVLQTPKIISVLSGHMSGSLTNSTKMDEVFFDAVFNCLPDSIMSTNLLGDIEVCNEAFQRNFSSQIETSKTLLQFLNHFDGDKSPLLLMQNNMSAQLKFRSTDDMVTYQVSTFISGQKYVLSFTDITQNVRYNTLINEEHEKSDKLLSSILPASLVKRVQKGESNISFAIQSVSIVFIDIVEFTPWCSSVPASTVMSTLNALFRSFDALIGKYATMTKIKCIGDCYMAAGGVFSEINQPATHAKEAVEFGLDAIDAIDEINRVYGFQLRIRVGINTGGPIIGGVLGIGKPTFEILGPAINLAQQMEHHGVPMAVHISRPVYELIYGNTFKIKERGNVEIKGGTVITYLVLKNN